MIHLIKIVLIFTCWVGIGFTAFTQINHTIHIGEIFKISNGTSIYFIGDFTDSSSSNWVVNEGDMYFNGDLFNNGTKNIFGAINTEGREHIIGTTSQISGTDTIYFHNLEINKNLNTDTVILNKFVIVNDSLLLTNGDILLNDSLELRFVGGSPSVSSPNGGLLNETDASRVYGPSYIKVTNVDWSSIGTKSFQNLKNVGIGLEVLDYLGTNKPLIYRYNVTQECGGNTGSIQRTFNFKNISQPGDINNISLRYLIPSEQGFLPNADSISVYYTNDNRDNWSDIGGTYGTNTVTNSTTIKQINNISYVTGAKDSCDYLPFIQFNQVNLNVVPTDTLIGVTTAQSCDFSDVNVQVIGDPGRYYWILPSGSLIPSDSGTYHTFSTLGTYTLVLEDRRGCIGRRDLVVSSAPNGNADFSFTSPSLCDGVQFNFVPDSANIPAYTYEWDMDNNGTFETNAYQVNSFTFPSSGVYSVGLKVTTDIGCSVSSNEQIIIQPIPVASFTASSACPGAPIIFNNTSTANPLAGVSLNWDFDNNGSVDATTNGNGSGTGGNTSHIFNAEGSYTVALTASSNGCTSLPYSAPVIVHPLPAPDFTFTNACESQPVQFTNASLISDFSTMTYQWNFNHPIGPNSSLTNPSFTYTSSTSYAVSLTATSSNGCVNDTTIIVDIDENPVADFNFVNACINNAISFADNSSIGNGTLSTWNWNFGNSNTSSNQNDTQTYTLAGNYNVSLVVSTTQGCTDSITKSVTVFDGPSPSYSVIDVCEGNSTTFINTSTNAVSYEWTLPSLGQTSTNLSPSFSFNNSGWHVAELEATSSNGCVGNFIDSVQVFPLPNIGLGANNTTCGTSFVLDASDGGNNAGATYFWNTGAATPQFTATFNGNFDVTVTSTNGCIANESTTVTLNSAVVPNISNQSACDLVVLDAGYPGPTTQYAWTGPNGFTATTQTINVTTLGTSTYSVTVIDQNGCTGSASANLVISTSSPVNFGPDQVKCVGDVVTLDAGTPGSTYAWNTSATTQTIDVTQDGFYSVVLTNAAGCISGDTIQFTFNTSPIVNLGNDASYCVTHQLNAFSANSSYLWNDLSVQPNITVTSSGQYFVEVTNTNTGCVASDTINLVINPLPIVNLGNDTILCSYQNLLIESNVPAVSYNWNTGETTPNITVASSGLYSVEVIDANGCENSDQINVLVNPIFSIDLGVDRPFCEGSTVILDLDTVFTNATYQWYDDSGILGNASIYSVLDTGVIYLDVVNQFGCEATDSITILPSNLSLFAVFLADSEVLAEDSIIFIDLSYPKPYELEWDMGNGFTTTDSVPIYAYFVPGDYDVSLTVDNGFCQSIRTKTITVSPIKTNDPQFEVPNLYSTIESLVLYPNPNNGDFNLKIKMTEESTVQVDIFNLMGQQVFNERFVTQETIRNYSLNNLRAGAYIVRVMSGKESKSLKFIKINH